MVYRSSAFSHCSVKKILPLGILYRNNHVDRFDSLFFFFGGGVEGVCGEGLRKM